MPIRVSSSYKFTLKRSASLYTILKMIKISEACLGWSHPHAAFGTRTLSSEKDYEWDVNNVRMLTKEKLSKTRKDKKVVNPKLKAEQK